ncbi:aspartyl protease family protein [Microbulbifer sp. SSSA002]|uniref:aspartyl protease family protein n=1 Tax=Microbulbifer sp. SSSA002 TaxID=3243376 RepID=UPI004039BE56
MKFTHRWLSSFVLICTMPILLGFTHNSAFAQDACELTKSSAENWIVRTPFEVIDGRIYVQVSVNGSGPFRFAVDTGASGMGRADSSLVSKLGLTIESQRNNSDGITVTKTDVTQFDSLQVDKLVRNNIKVLTRDYSSNKPPKEKFFGIVGRDFFEDGLVIIDYPTKMLYFTTLLTLSQEEGILQYERAFRIPVSIGSLQTTGNLDTGANVTFVLPQSMYTKLSSKATEKTAVGTLSNTKIRMERASIHGPLKMGNVTASDIEVLISERYPELLIGAHALQDMTILIDQRSKLVALCQQ